MPDFGEKNEDGFIQAVGYSLRGQNLVQPLEVIRATSGSDLAMQQLG